jgi:hypothetical protein
MELSVGLYGSRHACKQPIGYGVFSLARLQASQDQANGLHLLG